MKNLDKYLSLLHDGVDGLLLTSIHSRYYGAEHRIAEGVALVSKSGCRYFTDSRYIEDAQKGIRGFEVIMVDAANPYIKLLNEAIIDFGIATLGYEEHYLSVERFLTYESQLKAKLLPMQRQISAFRWVKEPWELDIMRQAQRITDQAFSEVLPKIKEGMTEKELTAELIYCLLKNGGEAMSFNPIVVSGPNTSLPHGVPGSRRIQKGDFITMDFGVVYKGYRSDMTRTVALGYVTEEMEKVYNIVLQAQTAAIAATTAGMRGKDIDAVARKVITDAGYGDYFGHGYGHGIGMEGHEGPRCAPTDDTVMLAGMASSAEPGIYLPGKFGVRIEDVVFFREDGCENITHSPKKLLII